MYNAETLLLNIKNKAKENNMNIKEVALKSGMSINALYNIKGKKGITCFNLARVADTLKCTTDELLGR